jgi:hypothetical protein
MCDHETAIANKFFGTIPGMILEARAAKDYPELIIPATLDNAVFLNRVSADPKAVFDKMMLFNKFSVMLSEHEADWTKEKCIGVLRAVMDSGAKAPQAVHYPRTRAHLQTLLQKDFGSF